MTTERDKFLIEAMNLCWHEKQVAPDVWYHRCTCGYGTDSSIDYIDHQRIHNINFSTWEGFGKLWEWAHKQEWWKQFVFDWTFSGKFLTELIHPDRFADAVYSYLKEAE